jgi:hypothetical protein
VNQTTASINGTPWAHQDAHGGSHSTQWVLTVREHPRCCPMAVSVIERIRSQESDGVSHSQNPPPRSHSLPC